MIKNELAVPPVANGLNGFAKLQAKFRGDHSRRVHCTRAAKACSFVCPFIASSKEVAELIVSAANISPGDCIIDLGCGDGALLLAAVESVKQRDILDVALRGYDIDSVRVAAAKRRLLAFGDMVRIEEKDIIDLDISDATIIFTFLVPSCMKALQAKFENCSLKSGLRVICYKFPMTVWTPDREWEVEDVVKQGAKAKVFLYQIN